MVDFAEKESVRKDQQIKFALSNKATSSVDAGFDKYRFEHNALPEIDFSAIDTSTKFLGRSLSLPLIISSITGGGTKSLKINKSLAGIANDYGIGFSVGSQTCALKDPSLTDSFNVRQYAPNALIFANIGASELNYGLTLDDCRRAMDMIDADALTMHLNPLHEVFQRSSTTNFAGLLKKIENVCKHLDAPVIVKEVGYGISASVAKKLRDAGVYAVEIAGAGSISWSSLEKEISCDVILRAAADPFGNWGNPTSECLEDISQRVSGIKIIASGGVNDGVKIAKSIALGADLCGNASTFLQKITESRAECENFVETLKIELKAAMFCTGCKNLNDLRNAKLKIVKEPV